MRPGDRLVVDATIGRGAPVTRLTVRRLPFGLIRVDEVGQCGLVVTAAPGPDHICDQEAEACQTNHDA
jgi:hypothetical protein